MERVSVRDLRLKTSALIKKVAQGKTYVIESRGVPVAELRPISAHRPINKLPRPRGVHSYTTSHRHRYGQDFGGGSDLKSNTHDDDLRLVPVEALRSRIDKALTALDC